ncbi:MAG: VOC family protein [Pseudomonadota bacterium]
MTPTPYLFFNGTCAEALATYAQVFGGEVTEMMPASQLPAEYAVPEDRRDWVMHACLTIGQGRIMASDDVTGQATPMAGCSVMMSLASAGEAKAAFNALAEGGTVGMAFAPTFWSAGFGVLTDRFGTKWMIGTDEAPGSQ